MKNLIFIIACFASLGTFSQTVEDLKKGEKLLVKYKSQGCFHFDNDEIKFENILDVVMVTYGEKTFQLTETQLRSVTDFEIKLKKQSDLLCTTTDFYEVHHKGVKKEYVDGSCAWNGFNSLLKNLNLEKQKIQGGTF